MSIDQRVPIDTCIESKEQGAVNDLERHPRRALGKRRGTFRQMLLSNKVLEWQRPPLWVGVVRSSAVVYWSTIVRQETACCLSLCRPF